MAPAIAQLKVGDKVLLYEGKVTEISKINVEILRMHVKVYNFEVENWNTYFVSDRNVLVHNMCAMKVKGRMRKQSKLRVLLNNDKISSALRGEIKRDINLIKKRRRRTIRVPKRYELTNRRGFEARKG